MVSTRKKRQQNKRLLNQLSESDTDFVLGQHDDEAQVESRVSTVDENITLNNENISTQANGSQMDVHTLEKKVPD